MMKKTAFRFLSRNPARQGGPCRPMSVPGRGNSHPNALPVKKLIDLRGALSCFAAGAAWRTPGEGSPPKNVPPGHSSPLLRFVTERNFALCGWRTGALPRHPAGWPRWPMSVARQANSHPDVLPIFGLLSCEVHCIKAKRASRVTSPAFRTTYESRLRAEALRRDCPAGDTRPRLPAEVLRRAVL